MPAIIKSDLLHLKFSGDKILPMAGIASTNPTNKGISNK
jgi:hypothetical protein